MLISRIITTFTRRRLGRLPSCVSSLAVAWYKDFNKPTTKSGTVYINDAIGRRDDVVFYGQYLTNASGQINLYRSSGTYDYIDPNDGSSSTGNAIPGDGLITVPANGMCEITTSDGSRYPVAERAGTVLHDVSGNGTHVSVATPTWAETLYGSDYLNQSGYADKTDSDAASHDWETTVNGAPVALNNSCLIPLTSVNTDARGLTYTSNPYGRVSYDLLVYEDPEEFSVEDIPGVDIPDAYDISGDELISET